jgi:hypothetical protein
MGGPGWFGSVITPYRNGLIPFGGDGWLYQ